MTSTLEPAHLNNHHHNTLRQIFQHPCEPQHRVACRGLFAGGKRLGRGTPRWPLATRARRAPGLLALYGFGPDTVALLLIAAWDHPERLRSEVAWTHLCAVAPNPKSSGKRTRHRLNRGGDRQANHALWWTVITRMSSHPPARAYVERRTGEGPPGKKSSAA